MTLLASLLVRVVGRGAAARFEAATKDPVTAQNRKLTELVQANRDTEYGRQCGFAAIDGVEAYRRSVPVVTYEDIRERIDRMARGEKRVLTAEDPVMFAQTSGTTGDPKLIPVTPACRSREHADQMKVWLHHAQCAHPGMLRGKVLSLVSPAVAGTTPSGIPYGSTSGMIYRDMHFAVRQTYALPYELFEAKAYEATYYCAALLGLGEDITFVATANPSSVLKLLETADAHSEGLIRDLRDGTLCRDLELEPEIRQVIEPRRSPDPKRAGELERARRQRLGKLLPADYWPNLALVGCWKGGTVGNAVESLAEWFCPDGEPMPPVRDWGYLSSEARGSIPLSDDGDGGVLTVNANLFEFVPAGQLEECPDDRRRWDFRGIHELELGEQYYVFLTTSGGLYRYDINDVVEMVGTHNRTPIISFRRKGRGMASITGEKLSEDQVVEAMANAAKDLDLSLEHFQAEADVENARYVFKVEGENGIPDERRTDLLKRLDEALSELNVEYQAKRSSHRLKPPVLQVMKHGWHDRHEKRRAEEGRPVFQAKAVHLDSKQEFHPEPEDLEAEVALDEAG